MDNRRSYGGRGGDYSSSALSKMQKTYWVTKQSVLSKLGKKDDECVVASDAELDVRLNLNENVRYSSEMLQKVIGKYGDKICRMSQQDGAFGRFLKECGKYEKTEARDVYLAVGSALTSSAHKILSLRSPLLRLHHEVLTFRQRALEDIQRNITAMEKSRTEYRATLNWMKEVSQQLDPDTHKQMERFRTVQNQVRQSKERFEEQKLICIQKIDLLIASRCNMFSQGLGEYQKQMSSVLHSVKTTYEDVKILETSQHNFASAIVKLHAVKEEEPVENSSDVAEANLLDYNRCEEEEEPNQDLENIPWDFDGFESVSQINEPVEKNEAVGEDIEDMFNLFGFLPSKLIDDTYFKDENASPDDIENKEKESPSSDLFEIEGEDNKTISNLLPSNLLDSELTDIKLEKDMLNLKAVSCDLAKSDDKPNDQDLKGKKKTKELAAWFNLFSDLDPLANPDAVGETEQQKQQKC